MKGTVHVLPPDKMVQVVGEAERVAEADAVVNVPSAEYPVPVEFVA